MAPTMKKAALALLLLLVAWPVGCGPDDSGGYSSSAASRPGACVCYDGTFNFRSCVVTTDLAACYQTVTTCNPFFFTNSDCSKWCPSSPQTCP